MWYRDLSSGETLRVVYKGPAVSATAGVTLPRGGTYTFPGDRDDYPVEHDLFIPWHNVELMERRADPDLSKAYKSLRIDGLTIDEVRAGIDFARLKGWTK